MSLFLLSICHEVMGPDAMILVVRMLSFKPTFTLFHSPLSPSSRGSLVLLHSLPLSGIICMFEIIDILSEFQIPFCDHLAVLHHVICIKVKQVGQPYTALTNSFPDFGPVCCCMSSSNCCFLTCIQVSQEASNVVWCSHLQKNFPQFVVIHTVKGFSQ